jgi:hypothetical protein
MHIPKAIKIGGLFVGCLATTEQAGEYLRMPPQPALQHVMMTMGSSLTAIALFNNTTFAPIGTLAEPQRPIGATDVSS